MAEGNPNEVVTWDVEIPNGHKVLFKLKVYRLDVVKRTFDPLEYNTQCRTIPTSWEIELKYERVQEVYGTYTFSVKLRRNDTSEHRVKASLYVSFYDVDDEPAFKPISAIKDRMVHDDGLQGPLDGELQCTSDNILPALLREVVAVEVCIRIQNCHTGTDW
ncbi:hypothetical protein AVEN_63177-1 [Araneus ventricosus]|uniref:MATH domain-containing protein n=1 Tax=Araneus ventricosus TaxID=182803 RepID=A0A4Y2B1Z2_ARAVE|nr:hypothetical protein AVEN_63177-1 [Araneus ventricosus]